MSQIKEEVRFCLNVSKTTIEINGFHARHQNSSSAEINTAYHENSLAIYRSFNQFDTSMVNLLVHTLGLLEHVMHQVAIASRNGLHPINDISLSDFEKLSRIAHAVVNDYLSAVDLLLTEKRLISSLINKIEQQIILWLGQERSTQFPDLNRALLIAAYTLRHTVVRIKTGSIFEMGFIRTVAYSLGMSSEYFNQKLDIIEHIAALSAEQLDKGPKRASTAASVLDVSIFDARDVSRKKASPDSEQEISFCSL